MTGLSDSEKAATLKTFNDDLRKGTDWSPPRKIGGAMTAQFVSQSGKRCLALRQHGPAYQAGFAYVLTGCFCDPKGKTPAAQPFADAEILQTLQSVKLK